MDFNREELLSALEVAARALNNSSTIPGLDHFWFDGDYLYAYNGGLGVRVTFKTTMACGLPGRTLLGLLRSSSLEKVFIDAEEDVILQMGKSKVKVVSLEGDRNTWGFPSPTKKGYVYPDKRKGEPVASLPLTEDVLQAIERVSFVRYSGKPTQVFHNGITVIASKGVVEFYASDSTSIARASVEQSTKGLPIFVAPWDFVDRLLESITPGADLHLFEDCLLVEGKGVLICSNLLEVALDPDMPRTLEAVTPENDDAFTSLPDGLQPLLERATILAGKEEPMLGLTVSGKSLTLEGRYALGSLDETLPLEAKIPSASATVRADLLRRGLREGKTFALTDAALVMENGLEFVFALAAKHVPTTKKKAKATKEDEPDEAVPRRRKPSSQDAEVPF